MVGTVGFFTETLVVVLVVKSFSDVLAGVLVPVVGRDVADLSPWDICTAICGTGNVSDTFDTSFCDTGTSVVDFSGCVLVAEKGKEAIFVAVAVVAGAGAIVTMGALAGRVDFASAFVVDTFSAATCAFVTVGPG